MPTIDELKRMARRHNRNTHVGVAQSKASLTRELDTKNASMSPPDTGEAIPYRRRQRGSAVNKKPIHAPKGNLHPHPSPQQAHPHTLTTRGPRRSSSINTSRRRGIRKERKERRSGERSDKKTISSDSQRFPVSDSQRFPVISSD